eukprot:637940-Prymnesium_polylepis.1
MALGSVCGVAAQCRLCRGGELSGGVCGPDFAHLCLSCVAKSRFSAEVPPSRTSSTIVVTLPPYDPSSTWLQPAPCTRTPKMILHKKSGSTETLSLFDCPWYLPDHHVSTSATAFLLRLLPVAGVAEGDPAPLFFAMARMNAVITTDSPTQSLSA